MKFDPTKPVRTRGGRAAKIVSTSNPGRFPIAAEVEGCVRYYNAEGYWLKCCGEDGLDLVNVPEPAPAFDPTKPVQTRDGEQARIVTTDCCGDYPIVALIGKNESVSTHTYDGRYFANRRSYHNHDLINVPEAPKEVEAWANIYPGSSIGLCGVCVYLSRAGADRAASKNRIACVRLTGEYQPGDGLRNL